MLYLSRSLVAIQDVESWWTGTRTEADVRSTDGVEMPGEVVLESVAMDTDGRSTLSGSRRYIHYVESVSVLD